jgi:holo-[acyl-carrier protein] synthase
MIVGIGADLCEVRRMERELEREDHGFRDRVFTPAEISWCESMHRPAEHYAARFAAKEAVFKALSGAGPDRFLPSEVEIVRDPEGRPRVALSGSLLDAAAARGVGRVHVSLSHEAGFALAFAVAAAGSGSRSSEEEGVLP